MSVTYNIFIGNEFEQFEKNLEKLRKEQIVERLLNKDFTIWSDNSNEISNRLDWIDFKEFIEERLGEITEFAEEIRTSDYKSIILLGMGGSSLAPEVLSKVFGKIEGFPQLHILDTTHPETILEIKNDINLSETLFIVSTKSGGTIETISLMKYFYNLYYEIGIENPGSYFIAITDPESGLEKMALQYNFRKVFLNNPNIGGRFSVLSLFGIVPAALIGIDVRRFLDSAELALENTRNKDIDITEMNIGFVLGNYMATLFQAEKSNLTLFIENKYISLGDWIEQLVAESTGKDGKGVLPIIEKKDLDITLQKDSRSYILISENENEEFMNLAESIIDENNTLFALDIDDNYDLPELFFYWEIATAICGYLIGVHPFNQPDVELAKTKAKEIIAKNGEDNISEQVNGIELTEGLVILLNPPISSDIELKHKLTNYFFDSVNYIAIQAFLPYSNYIESSLNQLKEMFNKKLGIPATIGFGPRFLHSTGQLHKGDNGKGLFIQFSDKSQYGLPIPDSIGKNESSLTFDQLCYAQSKGDYNALVEKNRKVIRFELENSFDSSFTEIQQLFEETL